MKTPNKEELFANKFATMISRSKTYLNSRDIFDVYSISKQRFDHELFLDLAVLEVILMDLSYPVINKFQNILREGKFSGRIEHLIREEFVLLTGIIQPVNLPSKRLNIKINSVQILQTTHNYNG